VLLRGDLALIAKQPPVPSVAVFPIEDRQLALSYWIPEREPGHFAPVALETTTDDPSEDRYTPYGEPPIALRGRTSGHLLLDVGLGPLPTQLLVHTAARNNLLSDFLVVPLEAAD
jgi:hypothetical protein